MDTTVKLFILWFCVAPFVFYSLLLFGIVGFRCLPELFRIVLCRGLERNGKNFFVRLATTFLERQKEWDRVVKKEEKLLNVGFVLYGFALMLLLLLVPILFIVL